MRVCVIGAGVVGLATAYALLRDGYEVTVLDRREGAGLETSFANGGQLSYAYVAPFASPSVLKSLPAWLLDPKAPTRFRPRLDPRQWSWIANFLRASTAAQSAYTTEHLLHLSFLSRAVLHQAIEQEKLSFNFTRNGKLVVYSTAHGLEGAKAQMAFQAQLGCEQSLLSREECVALEPALTSVSSRIVGGIYTPSEESGDAYLLCRELESVLSAAGARLVYGVRAGALVAEAGRIVALTTGKGDIEADYFVLSAGNGSAALARTVGLNLPIYPIRGFSVSAPVTDASVLPKVSVTDYDRKVVYARLGPTFRAAAMADIVGYSTRIDARRLGLLYALAQEAFPAGADYDDAAAWCGLRPATPTGLPVISATPWSNLVVNSGHGALGFTLAMGAGSLCAAMVSGRSPAIPTAAFSLP